MHAADKGGMTAVMYASKGGHVECVKYLVGEGGADANAVDKDGMTAVMMASQGVILTISP